MRLFGSASLGQASGKHKGFGFVQFVSEEDAEAAIDNMHENELFGRTLRVPPRSQDKGVTPGLKIAIN